MLEWYLVVYQNTKICQEKLHWSPCQQGKCAYYLF